MAVFQVIVAWLMLLPQLLSPVFQLVAHGGEEYFFTDWSVNDEFKLEDTIILEKDPAKDFVILNLADVQLKDLEAFSENGQLADATIDKLIKDTAPDLITLTGDNAWQTAAYVKLIKQIDSYGIPWAPVMGNHDGQGLISEFWAAYKFTEADNCLFKFGPKDMGYGNYIINITENGKVIHTVYMLDTHSDGTFTDDNGNKVSGYDHLWANQMEWYKWAVNGINAITGSTVESSVFMHIPVVEYDTAWKEAYDEDNDCFIGEYAATSFGVNHEGVCCSPVNNGFFALCKELGSTKNMIVGHDHINSSSILYQGIRLTYGLKTGSGCYWNHTQNGGTTLTVSADGAASINHVYVDQADFGFNIPDGD